jgi:hypothetical protein
LRHSTLRLVSLVGLMVGVALLVCGWVASPILVCLPVPPQSYCPPVYDWLAMAYFILGLSAIVLSGIGLAFSVRKKPTTPKEAPN